MAKTALILIAHGSEEMEAATPIDILRRAGMEVTVAGLESGSAVVCSRNVGIVPDCSLTDAVRDNKTYDIIILPGGLKGAESFAKCETLGNILKAQEKEDRYVAAICAAPTALAEHGIGEGKKLTSYPSVKDKLTEKYKYQEDRVVMDGKLITSRGPGTAIEFSLAIIKELLDDSKASEVAKAMLIEGY